MGVVGCSAILMAATYAASPGLSHAQGRAGRIEELSRTGIRIRSIDPTVGDDDFADLKPLIAAIGDSRIVVLGEQSHGDGATFLIKARLVKFLHQRMGFDVLAWEAGMFNCHDMDAAVRSSSVPLGEAIQRGVPPVWGMSAQVRPVFEYARSVAATNRPLEMIGFDHQFSGVGGPGMRWCNSIVELIDKADPTILPGALRSSLLSDSKRVVFQPDSKPEEIRSVAEKWKGLPLLLEASRSKLESAHGARQVALMLRSAGDALVSLEGLARFREAGGKSKAADNNIRDQRMAENLIWLANERYKGRRIIVWVAIFHALYEPSAIKLGPDDAFSFQDVITMGHVARKSLGNQIYTVGFTAAKGSAGDVMGGRTLDLPKPAKGSFEDLCMRVGRRFLFVDFRGLSATHWLRKPISARPFDHSPTETDWTRQMDAIVFTDAMFPSTKERLAPPGAVLVDQPTSRRAHE